jgi:hypothetical protein
MTRRMMRSARRDGRIVLGRAIEHSGQRSNRPLVAALLISCSEMRRVRLVRLGWRRRAKTKRVAVGRPPPRFHQKGWTISLPSSMCPPP